MDEGINLRNELLKDWLLEIAVHALDAPRLIDDDGQPRVGMMAQ